MTKKAYVSRLFSIVTRSENRVKIAGFLTLAQKHIFQKKFTIKDSENGFRPRSFLGNAQPGALVWRKLSAVGKRENEEICKRAI